MNNAIENFTQQYGSAYRLESAVDTVKKPARQAYSGSRGLFAVLFSAVTAAAWVVSYEIMDSVEEGHLLIMWMALWYVAFAALAMLGGTARRMSQRLKASANQWVRDAASKRADERLWDNAKSNPRLMADLQAARLRQSVGVEACVAWGDTIVKSSPHIARDYTNGYGYV
ncbi:hypothetical protein RCH06_002966 [Polaromonas sp. CG_9.5]|uniref:hypothetical protein n=1 Tax=Polaromonas sp. CG_9.5 TaxID=3071705 RepID=UPI002E02206D|nr:hypothetical protein [Polaromonas sp. CG_9.5]